MAATQWRLHAFSAQADVVMLRISLLVGGVDVASTATVTCSHVPVDGALANLTDGDDLTACTFAQPDVCAPGFYLDFTFSAAVEIDEVQLLEADRCVDLIRVSKRAVEGWQTVAESWMTLDEPLALSLSPLYHSTALALSPSSYFPLTQTSGDALDAVGTARLLVHSNAIRSGVALTNGLNGYRLSARSGNFPLLRGPDSSFGNLVGDFSFSFVLKGAHPAGESLSRVFTKEVGGQIWPEYQVAQNGGLLSLLVRYADSNGATLINATASKNILDGALHHLVFVKLGARYLLYVDGSAVIDATGAGTPTTGRGVLGIGGDVLVGGYTSSGFIGDIAGVALYAKALSGAEVASLSASLTGAVASTPRPVTVKRVRADAAEHGAAPLAQGFMALAACGVPKAQDVEFGGKGVIYGTVELYVQGGNIPLPRRVRLQRSRDSLLVREVWSDAQGNYRFDGISERYTYDVIAWDHEGLQQSVVANDLTPEVLP